MNEIKSPIIFAFGNLLAICLVGVMYVPIFKATWNRMENGEWKMNHKLTFEMANGKNYNFILHCHRPADSIVYFYHTQTWTSIPWSDIIYIYMNITINSRRSSHRLHIVMQFLSLQEIKVKKMAKSILIKTIWYFLTPYTIWEISAPFFWNLKRQNPS